MKIYVIERDYGDIDCWGRGYFNWVKTDIFFTDENDAKKYVENSRDYRYIAVETQ